MVNGVISFLTTKQSERNQVFMFIWRILLAVLLTQHQMQSYCYEIKKLVFSPNAFTNFLFSPDFLLLICIYLFYIFFFFWAFKIIGFGLLYTFSFKQNSEKETLKVLKFLNFVNESKNEIGYSVSNIKTFQDLDAIIKDKEIIAKSIFLARLGDYTNVLFSTTIALMFLSCKMMKVIDRCYIFALNIGFWLLCLFAVLAVIYLLKIFARTDNLEEVRNKLFDIYNKENPSPQK